jgi:hypothetical protein
MGVFLALSILGVGFYAVLLLALFLDGRKGRAHRVHVFNCLEFGRDSAPASAVAGRLSAATQSHLPPMDDVLWIPVTKVHWKGKTAHRECNPDDAVRVGRSHSHRACKETC